MSLRGIKSVPSGKDTQSVLDVATVALKTHPDMMKVLDNND